MRSCEQRPGGNASMEQEELLSSGSCKRRVPQAVRPVLVLGKPPPVEDLKSASLHPGDS